MVELFTRRAEKGQSDHALILVFSRAQMPFFSLHSLYVHHSSNLNNYAMHARRNLYMASLSINQVWILPVQFLYDYLEDLQVRYELFLEVLLYCEQEDLYIHGLSL